MKVAERKDRAYFKCLGTGREFRVYTKTRNGRVSWFLTSFDKWNRCFQARGLPAAVGAELLSLRHTPAMVRRANILLAQVRKKHYVR